MDPDGRAAALGALERAATTCAACGLAESRARVIVGGGPPDAEVLVVGESPGFQEERDDASLAGRAGALLEELLAGVGLRRADVYLTTVLKCRPPGNRDPLPEEVAACEPHLFRQVELVRPQVVATLGTFATRLLSGRPHAITRVHGCPQELTIGAWRTTLLPLYHPAAALYTPTMLRTLEEDIARIPELLGRTARAGRTEPVPAPSGPTAPAASDLGPAPAAELAQLGLF